MADIAAHAGLTERTFFRHYADKREVLFGGAGAFQDELVRAVAEVPPERPTIDVVRIAIGVLGRLMHGRRELARERERVVTAHADLRERGLIKRAALTDALAVALEQRGVAKAAARLAAELGVTVFYNGFERWLDDSEPREFAEILDDGFDQLKAVVSGA